MRNMNGGSRRRWGHRDALPERDRYIVRVEEASVSRGNPDGPSFVSEILLDRMKHLKQLIYREK